MSDRGWKQAERRLARAVGTRRIAVTGERNGADFRRGMFAYQSKLRRVIPRWLFKWSAGIVRSAADRDQIGILILKRPHMRDRDALVVLRWQDWVELHGADERR